MLGRDGSVAMTMAVATSAATTNGVMMLVLGAIVRLSRQVCQGSNLVAQNSRN